MVKMYLLVSCDVTSCIYYHVRYYSEDFQVMPFTLIDLHMLGVLVSHAKQEKTGSEVVTLKRHSWICHTMGSYATNWNVSQRQRQWITGTVTMAPGVGKVVTQRTRRRRWQQRTGSCSWRHARRRCRWRGPINTCCQFACSGHSAVRC